jgi:serine/threonine-protein kinase
MRKFPLLLFILLMGAAAVLISNLAGQLPDLVAVHFDAAGRANGFMTRAGCRDFMLLSTLGVPLLITLATALIPRLVPASLINIPNRDYWLAPERARDSLAFLSEQGLWFGCIFVVFLACVDTLLVKANAVSPPAFPNTLFVAMLILFFCVIGAWFVRMLRRFRGPT